MSNRVVNFLLVEDDDNHAHLVTRSLARSEVSSRVFRVVDGVEALDFLNGCGPYRNRVRPDVVLLDLKLPRMDGHEVLASIKRDSELKTIPVVVMTTSGAETDRIRAYRHHANSYVVKPVDFDKFRQLVSDLCLYWGIWNESPEDG